MKSLRMGLVGFAQGYYATLYSRICSRRKDVEFIGVCDLGMPPVEVEACAEITAEEFARELGVPLVHTFEELLEKELQALIITSETADHHRYAISAIERGIHVFIGKPMTVSSAAAREIIAARAQHPQVVILPGEPARYEDGMIQGRQSVRAGEVGKPLMAHLSINHPAMTNHPWQMDVARSGGPFIEFGSYVADLAEWVIGSPVVSVYALAENFIHPQIGGPDNGKLLCQHANGTLSSLDVLCSIHWNYPFLGLEVICERGSIRADYHNYSLYVQRSEESRLAEPRTSAMNQREIEHFLDCVLYGTQPIITPEEYLSTILILEAACTSLETKLPVRNLRDGS
jgi:xylose dehydrogenase (NAD/NADP)